MFKRVNYKMEKLYSKMKALVASMSNPSLTIEKKKTRQRTGNDGVHLI